MKLLKRGIEIVFVISILLLILHLGQMPEYINGYTNEKILIKEHEDQRECRAILIDENTIDLGNHIVAYLISGKAPGGLKGKWIVICDVEKGNSFFIPNDFSEITNISLSDPSNLYVKGRGDMDDCYKEISVPLFWTDKYCDYVEIYSYKQKTILDSTIEAEKLPECIWEEAFLIGSESYKLTFDKISLVYGMDSEVYGEFANYQLILKDKKDNIIYQQIFIGLPINYENVHWFIDISNDGVPDIILCTDYDGYSPPCYTRLFFLIWNSEKFTYERAPLRLPFGVGLGSPVWNQELSSIMFFDDDEEKLSKYMYSFMEGNWELVRQITSEKWENGRIYEVYYEDGERIEKEIILSPGEEMPWHDRSNVWCKDNVGNEYLFPNIFE